MRKDNRPFICNKKADIKKKKYLKAAKLCKKALAVCWKKKKQKDN